MFPTYVAEMITSFDVVAFNVFLDVDLLVVFSTGDTGPFVSINFFHQLSNFHLEVIKPILKGDA